MRRYLIGGLVGAGLVLVLGWIGSCGVPWDTAEAKALRARTDSLTVALEAVDVRADSLMARNDSLRAAVRADSSRADSASRAADRHSLRAAQTADSLRVVLVGQQDAIALLNALEREHTDAMEGKDTAIAALTRNVDRLTVQNDSLMAVLTAFRTASDSLVAGLKAEVMFWQEAAESARGGWNLFGLRVPDAVGYALAGIGGYAIGRAF